jgi:hypothetical protein
MRNLSGVLQKCQNFAFLTPDAPPSRFCNRVEPNRLGGRLSAQVCNAAQGSTGHCARERSSLRPRASTGPHAGFWAESAQGQDEFSQARTGRSPGPADDRQLNVKRLIEGGKIRLECVRTG